MLRAVFCVSLVVGALGCGTDTSGGDGGTCADTWAGYGQAFFTSTCASCHTHNHSSLTSQATVQAEAATLESYISSGTMPQGASLTGAEKTRIANYLNCGAK
jgi:hypothetical protein